MPEKKELKAKTKIVKPDKKVPKIRIVTLDEKSRSKKADSRAAMCVCDGDCPSFECRPQVIVCDCDPQCHCDGNTDEKKQQQPKKGKEEHRTFFKIAGSEKNYYPLLPPRIL